MFHENPVKLPPGIIESSPPDEESHYARDLGTSAKVTWSWLKSKFGKMPHTGEYDRDFYNGKTGRLYILVRPFDLNNQWIDNLRQEFTYDGLRDAQRYGFELVKDMPNVGGFWISGCLDKYWPAKGESRDIRVIDLGVYERASMARNSSGVTEYRGMRIEAIDNATQLGYRTGEGHRGKGRNIGRQYLIHLGEAGDGGTKMVSTMRAAREYIDEYLGPEHTPNARHSSNQTVVQYAVQAMFKGKSPAAAARYTAERLSGGTNMFIDSSNEVDIDPAELEEALWENMAAYATTSPVRPGNERNVARGTLMYFNQWKWGKPPKIKMEDKLLAHMSKIPPKQHAPNSSSHYVWVLLSDGTPKDEGPYGPYDLEAAKSFARISATNGAHDRAVSRGLDPRSPSFGIVRRYRRGTGEPVS